MPGYFYDDDDRSKLTVLYFMNSLDIELTRLQIGDFSVTYDLVPYFEVQQTVAELEEGGFIAAIPRPFGQVYRLTEAGKRTLAMFVERIPYSQRVKMDAYADESRITLKRQTQLTTNITTLPAKEGYMVTLRAVEGERLIYSIDIALPDSTSANRAVERWQRLAPELYMMLIDKLAREIPPKDNQE